jgi:hypothetical protein
MIQALVGAVCFTIISVILEGTYTQEVWIEKGLRGLLFGGIYGVYIAVRGQFKKNKEKR